MKPINVEVTRKLPVGIVPIRQAETIANQSPGTKTGQSGEIHVDTSDPLYGLRPDNNFGRAGSGGSVIEDYESNRMKREPAIGSAKYKDNTKAEPERKPIPIEVPNVNNTPNGSGLAGLLLPGFFKNRTYSQIADAVGAQTPVAAPANLGDATGIVINPNLIPKTNDPKIANAVVDYLRLFEQGGRAKFDTVSFPVWRRKSADDETKNMAAGGLQDRVVPKGTYQFVMNVPDGFNLPFVSTGAKIPFTVSGKQCQLDAFEYMPETKTAKMQIRVIENPIPILLLAAGALTAGGFALNQLTGSLKEVRYVIKDSWILAGACIAVLAGYWFFIKKRGA